MNRDRALEDLRSQRFDVVVIGGGITGAGVALDATSRGLRVALVEKTDFAFGTSSRSSKVIHGGLRYLKSLQLGIAVASVREREILLRMAPHLVRPLPILLPYHRSAAYRAALSIYDAIALWPAARRHQQINIGDMSRLAPHLADGVRGAFVYYDAAADDCRLVMHVVKKAAEIGAVVANYCGVEALNGDGVEVLDSIAKERFPIRAQTIVNATGVWADSVREKFVGGVKPLMRASKGIHLVVDSAKLQLDAAVAIPKTSSGHYLFIAPWEGRTIIGTTDTEYNGDPDRPLATPTDVDLLLEAVAEWFPTAHLTARDILAVYAGLRPLAASGRSTAAASREDFVEQRDRVITVAGGKLTTFRRMAKRVVDLITRVPCATDRLSLFSSPAPPAALPPPIAAHLHRAFGSEAHAIARMPGADAPLIESDPHTEAEIDYIIENEMPMEIADLLARRTRLALTTADHARSLVEKVAGRLAARHRWDPARRQTAIDEYLNESRDYGLPKSEGF